MSELQWNWVYRPYLDAPEKQKESARSAGYAKVVFKSEADMVIADLEAENEKLNAQFYPLYEELKRVKDENESLKKTLQHSEDELESYFIFEKEIKQEIRHHKYRRCLDQVEICRTSSVYFFRISETTKDEGAATEFRRISDWYDKWEERWLKLAEKFKEVK